MSTTRKPTTDAFSRDDVDRFFTILATKLQNLALSTSKGGTRTASADEFMLMHTAPLRDGSKCIAVGFKHRNTRNYLFVYQRFPGSMIPIDWSVYVPATDEPFKRGWFDE